MCIDCNRFRPLAGFWFLNSKRLLEKRRLLRFPSPCGVLVLKCKRMYSMSAANFLFPSPCGVLVLKYSPCEALLYLDENAILRRGDVERVKSSVRLFENLPCPPSCLARRGFLSRAWVSPQDIRENTAGQSPRRIHVIYCALIESSMNLLPSFAFWRTSSVMSAPASTMTTPLSILMVRVAFLPRRKRR